MIDKLFSDGYYDYAHRTPSFMCCKVLSFTRRIQGFSLYLYISMAKLTRDDVLKLAQLSKLSLTDAELDRFQKELEAIVGYVEQLQDVDTTGLAPTNQVSGLSNVLRDDEVRSYVDPQELLKGVPQRDGDYIKVKRVLE